MVPSGLATIAVFTRGHRLKIRSKANLGSSGVWKVDPARRIDEVIIYCREQGAERTLLWTRRAATREHSGLSRSYTDEACVGNPGPGE